MDFLPLFELRYGKESFREPIQKLSLILYETPIIFHKFQEDLFLIIPDIPIFRFDFTPHTEKLHGHMTASGNLLSAFLSTIGTKISMSCISGIFTLFSLCILNFFPVSVPFDYIFSYFVN